MNKRPSVLMNDGSGYLENILLASQITEKCVLVRPAVLLEKEVGTYKACVECSSLNKTSSALCSKSIDKAPCEVGPLNSKGK